MNAGLVLAVGAVRIASRRHQPGRQEIANFRRLPHEAGLCNLAAGEQLAQPLLVESVDVPPWRVGLAAVRTGRAVQPQILLVRHADQQVAARHPRQFRACSLEQDAGNMFKHFGAKYQVETAVGKIERGSVTLYAGDARVVNGGLLQVKRGDAHATIGQRHRDKTIARADVHRRACLRGKHRHQIGYARLFNLSQSPVSLHASLQRMPRIEK